MNRPQTTGFMPPPPAAVSRRSWLVTVAVFVLGIAVAGYFVSESARDQARDIRKHQAQIAHLSTRLQVQDKQLATQNKGTAVLGTRLDGLEAAALDAKNHTVARTAATVKKSVVIVIAGDSQGSAFAVSSSAGTTHLVTNFHVVDDLWTNGLHSVKIQVGDSSWTGQITRVNEVDDLALISVAATFPVLKIDRATPAVGDPVIAVGSPLGLEGSVSTGIVSAIRKEDGRKLIQTTTAISPGNSGGPLVDRDGAVLGVNEMKIVGNGVEGLAFAIPAEVVCADLSVCT
jgi:S1-C subfamily serine protease